ncbi:hypothetical protein GCM10023195_64120 [Actinoallomurus liliacearum]|uniref:Uncharacterized protein n=1 Tax=Actinoallomurus liliacearum TaxID=1080073 RepID=A0ABP8TRD4_9ACTN
MQDSATAEDEQVQPGLRLEELPLGDPGVGHRRDAETVLGVFWVTAEDDPFRSRSYLPKAVQNTGEDGFVAEVQAPVRSEHSDPEFVPVIIRHSVHLPSGPVSRTRDTV